VSRTRTDEWEQMLLLGGDVAGSIRRAVARLEGRGIPVERCAAPEPEAACQQENESMDLIHTDPGGESSSSSVAGELIASLRRTKRLSSSYQNVGARSARVRSKSR
jgi:hypothetical protein